MADFSALIKAKIDTTDIKKQLKQVGTTEKITIKADTKEVTAGLRAVTTQTEKYKNALGQATTVTRSYNTAGEQVSGTMKTVTASTATATKATKSLGQEFISTIGKVAKFGAATAVIGLFTTAVYQAWEAIKGFDAAVTDFKKVSDLSGNSLTEYTKKLGDLGASLGRTRTQMLEASTEFVKAGYTEEQSAILAQTATLFQNVADSEVSAADSASYVISQMKAFNIEATDAISIIDKTNEVANRFAVSSTDISLALTKSSSALATYGNDINQSIGLVTAGTEIMTNQASKVSKGLRSIGAQLVKMATSTGELSYKIQGATKTLSLFDEQTGEMKSTYDILLEISQSWDKMEVSEKSALAVQVAGKTQIDVFTSVLGNFNTAINANATALNSAGSAAKENAAYMESLEAKINGLKAQFENLVLGDGGVASFIKLIIDGGTSLLKFANTDLGKVIIAGGLAITMFNALRTSVMGLNLVWGAFNIATWATQFAQGLAVVTAGTNIFTGSVAALTAIWNSSPFVAISLVIAGVYALVKVFDALTTSFKEQQEIVANLKTEIQSLQSEYDALASKSTRTADEEAYLKILEAEIALKKQDLIIESKRAYQKYQKTQTPTSGMQVISGDFGGGELAASKIEDYNKQLLELDINSKNYAETKEKLISKRAEEITKMVAERDLLQDILNVGGELTPEEQARLDRYNSLIVASSSLGGATGDLADETDGLTDSLEEEKTALQSLIESLNSVKDATDSVKDAFKDFNEDGSLTYSTIADIADKFADVEGIDEYVNRLADASLTGDELNQIMGELTMALIEQKIATGELDATQTSLITKMLEEAGIANAAQIANQLLANSQNNLKFSGENAAVGLTKEQKAAIQAKIALFQTQRAAKSLSGTTLDPFGILAGLNKIIAKSSQAASALTNVTGGASIVAALKGASASGVTQFGKTSIIPQIQWTTDVASGGGSGGGGATTDPIEEQSKAFKEQNKILEHQLFLLEQREGTELEQVELQKKIQEQLYQQAEWYRAQGVDENSDYLRDLSESWWKYEKSIQDIYDDIAKAAQESAKKQLEAQKEALEIQKDNFETAIDYYVGLIDKEIDALEAEKEAIQDRYDAQIDALKETNSELDNQIEREKLLSNLAKAKSTQKLVYKDGKYQYVSNIQAISEAQQALNEFDRQRKLEREVAALERARDAEVKAIDDQIKAWQDYAKEWKNIVNDYQNSQNKLIAEQVLGISLEKLNWDTRLQNAQDFVTKYNSIMSQIEAVEQQEQALVAGTDSDTYTDSTDWSQTWKDADARYKSGEYSKEQADAIKDYAHEQKTSEMQGSGKTFNPTSGEWYANGTTSASGGLSMVGERGAELRVLNKGDGIIPHNITENLMALGKYSPANLMNKLSSVGSGSNVYQYSFDKLVLPNVSDANSFVKALQNFKPMAIQAGSSR